MSEELVKAIQVVDDNNIKGFFGPYRFLSNFEKCNIEFEGLKYTSTEAAFQASKCIFKKDRIPFTKMTPTEAKKAGKLVKLSSDWESVKVDIMTEINQLKYSQVMYSHLLLKTGDKYLEETNWWGDVYWGVCKGVGNNYLGHILMKIRGELRLQI